MSATDVETDTPTTTPRRESGPDMGADHAGLQVLSYDDCLRHLRTARVGRVAFVADGEPVILPVNHGMDGDAVVFRSSPGSKLDAASDEMPVAFEVDNFDADRHSGWSVVVRGTARLVTDRSETQRLTRLGVWPWAESVERRHWIRIRPFEITGRQIPPHGD
ncbi:pyridoxamine 5'-phosphate oxidase family protein [Nakamurella flava]|nr:pyridoxamine 5'-phosphate oxidase family protein [Nakamurella flava]